jgi:predicted amidophosphoribosyltransferase
MTYFECASCQARLYSSASPDKLFRDFCSCCGSPLETVGDFADAGGYRSTHVPAAVTRRSQAAPTAPAP